jgi:hypothetical protein
MSVVWGRSAFEALACLARGVHHPSLFEAGEMCDLCDTGTCLHCAAPVFYHKQCGDYHHIYKGPDCFLHSYRCFMREEMYRG